MRATPRMEGSICAGCAHRKRTEPKQTDPPVVMFCHRHLIFKNTKIPPLKKIGYTEET